MGQLRSDLTEDPANGIDLINGKVTTLAIMDRRRYVHGLGQWDDLTNSRRTEWLLGN